MKSECSLYEFRDDLAHSLQLLKEENSVCVWDAGELPSI